MLSLLSFFDALTAPIPASSQGKRFTSSFYYSAAENLPDFRALRLISATTMRAPRSCALLLLPAVAAWRRTHAPPPVARRRFVEGAVAALAATTTARSNAYSGQDKTTPKAKNLPPKELAKRVEKDLVENQFLATANFDRTLYDEACTFQDEIDTYELDKFIKGTSKLFVADRSHVDLTSLVTASNDSVEFAFKEDLCFNIPFKPTVFVSGRVVLTRDLDTGLFVRYREYWDQKPNDVLRGARF